MCSSWGCPLGFTAGATIPGHPLSWGPSYHKITNRYEGGTFTGARVTIIKMNKVTETLVGVAVGVMSAFYPMGLQSGQAAWGKFTWSTPFPPRSTTLSLLMEIKRISLILHKRGAGVQPNPPTWKLLCGVNHLYGLHRCNSSGPGDASDLNI